MKCVNERGEYYGNEYHNLYCVKERGEYYGNQCSQTHPDISGLPQLYDIFCVKFINTMMVTTAHQGQQEQNNNTA